MPKHIVKAAGLAGNEASVIIEVYDDENPGSILATIPHADIERVGLSNTYVCDLKALSVDIDLPEDGSLAEKFYTLIWKDDTGVDVVGDYQARGYIWPIGDKPREIPIYPSTTVFSRGITQNVIDAGKPSYIRREYAPDGDFDNPALVDYEIFEYDAQGRVSKKTPSATPPAP